MELGEIGAKEYLDQIKEIPPLKSKNPEEFEGKINEIMEEMGIEYSDMEKLKKEPYRLLGIAIKKISREADQGLKELHSIGE